MTLSVLEGHSPIASFFKCDISYLWHVARSLCICRASYYFELRYSSPIELQFYSAMAGLSAQSYVRMSVLRRYYIEARGNMHE